MSDEGKMISLAAVNISKFIKQQLGNYKIFYV